MAGEAAYAFFYNMEVKTMSLLTQQNIPYNPVAAFMNVASRLGAVVGLKDRMSYTATWPQFKQ